MKLKIFVKTIVIIVLAIGFHSTAFSICNDSLLIQSLGHGSVRFEFNKKVIYVDPNSGNADYDNQPEADLIFLTHIHGDHYDMNAINKIKTESTIVVFTQIIKDEGSYTDSSIVMNNGDSIVVKGIPVSAVPMYNIEHLRSNNEPYHIKGEGNGYVLNFNLCRVYLAGDTENIPEMDSLIDINIAFIPMNLPYTMTPEMAADAGRMIDPDILYIYHFGSSDTNAIRDLLSDEPKIEIRIATYEEPTDSGDATSLNKVINNKVDFFPNPVVNSIQISALIADRLSIYNLSGQLLFQKTIQKNTQTFDLNFLTSGLYLVELNNDYAKKTSLLHKY